MTPVFTPEPPKPEEKPPTPEPTAPSSKIDDLVLMRGDLKANHFDTAINGTQRRLSEAISAGSSLRR